MNNDLVSLATPVPVVKGRFGELVTYSTSVRASEMVRLLEHDPRKLSQKPELRAIYKEIQRVLAPSRRKGVQAYLDRRLPRKQIAGFPAISIGLTHPPLFVPIENMPGLGQIHMSDGHRLLLDGFGRTGGTLDFIESVAGATYARDLTIPVVFYAAVDNKRVLSPEELAILFADYNFRVNPVQDRIAMVHDPDDLYIQMTRDLRKEPFLAKYGGVEERAASLGGKSKALTVQKTLLRVVRGAVEGRAAQESNDSLVSNARLSTQSYNEEYRLVADFFNDLATHMGDARWPNRSGWHLSPSGFQAIGLVAFAANHSGVPLTPAQRAKVFNEISLTTNEQVEHRLANMGIKGGGRSSKQSITDMLMTRCDLTQKSPAGGAAA